ncbi:hypothetical protein BDR06DRAFT_204049 [Suillus hirtellus]|nr:hypothetical protein BDR06DRAFT_204049 [Suillus hirtellus]
MASRYGKLSIKAEVRWHGHRSFVLTYTRDMSFTSGSPSFWPATGCDDLHFRFIVASTTIIFYDYVSLSGLAFTREVELIWCQRWRLTTVLYIIARYLGLAIAM